MDLPANIPSRLLLQPSRLAIAQTQARLDQAQAEVATGRHADIGLTLGAQTGSSMRMRIELSAIDFSMSGIKQAATRAEITQTSLRSLSTLLDRFRSSLTAARSGENGRGTLESATISSMEAMQDLLSASYDGQYLFSGLRTDTPPLKKYDEGPRLAVVAAFEAEFGFAPEDPAAALLTGPQIDDFIANSLENLFLGPGWQAEWSNATDTLPDFRVSPNQSVTLATSANAAFVRKLAQSFSIVDVLGRSAIGNGAFEAAIDSAMAMISEAQISMGQEQARIGFGQAALKEAEPVLNEKKISLTSAIQSLENVSSYEVATRVTLLMTQLESSYALTARMGKLSLLSYI